MFIRHLVKSLSTLVDDVGLYKLELHEWYLLFTGTCSAGGLEASVGACVTEFQTIPQILSTQTPALLGFWTVGLKVFVAHGILNQSVLQFESVLVPVFGTPALFCPVILKAMEFAETESMVNSN